MTESDHRPTRRDALLRLVADWILELPHESTVRVAIDGVDGAGKTTFGDALAVVLAESGRPVIRAGVDRFHNPRSTRYSRGRGSREGFYRDSYDYATLCRVLLDPLAPGGSGRFRRGVFDVDRDEPLDEEWEVVEPGSILVFDGIFAHRTELRTRWDFSVLLRVEWLRNHHVRNRPADDFGPQDPRNDRYRLGQDLYFAECEPWKRASNVIDNDDVDAPFVVDA